MEGKKLNSLNVNGMGTYGGGEFECVNVSGKCKIIEEINCESIDVSGSATFEGNVACLRGRVSGSCKVEKDINAEEISISGIYKQNGSAVAQHFEVSGIAKIKQCLSVNKLYSSGILNVKGDINGEEVRSEGIINCGGLLNCESLEIYSMCGCKLNEVGAAIVKIRQQGWKINKLISLFVPQSRSAVVNVIEGDDIYLEECDVKVIRGKNVKLGKSCHIDTIEYSGTFEKDDASTVENLVKVGE